VSGQEAAMLLQLSLGVVTVHIILLRVIIVVQLMEDVSSYVTMLMDDALVTQAMQCQVITVTIVMNAVHLRAVTYVGTLLVHSIASVLQAFT